MVSISAPSDTVDALKIAVLRKHGKLRGAMLDEVNTALLSHLERLSTESARQASG